MKLKICGMKYQENISEVAKLQPNYLGFIFYEKSSRLFDETIPELPNSVKKVGVFVDASIESIMEKATKYNLDLIQLHGKESPEFCKELKKNDLEIIKVFPINAVFNFDELKPYESVCDYFLFDTLGKLPGGNGYTFNWEVLTNYRSTKPYFLSGGIGLEEIKKLEQFIRSPKSKYCHAIDVNSKFEIEPGLKDVAKLKSLKKEIDIIETN